MLTISPDGGLSEEARSAMRALGIVWIGGGLLVAPIGAWGVWETLIEVDGLTARRFAMCSCGVLGAGLVGAGAFAWQGSRRAATLGLVMNYLLVVACALPRLIPALLPLAVLALAHRAIWLASPVRAIEAAARGKKGTRPSARDWITTALVGLVIGPVLGLFAGVLAFYALVSAGIVEGYGGLAMIGGAMIGSFSMACGGMVGVAVGTAWSSETQDRAHLRAFASGCVASSVGVVLMGQIPFSRQPVAQLLGMFLLVAAFGGCGGVLSGSIARGRARASRPSPIASDLA